MIAFSRLGLFAALLGSLVGNRVGIAQTVKAQRPNIVMILTDDQGWWDMSLHGNPVLKTPAIDRLAREGVEFERYYVSPVCSLSRASLMTGRYYPRTGCFDTRFGHDTMRASEVTVAELLQQSGYRTGLFGKWHLGRYMPQHPNNQGFDEFFGFWKYGHVERYFYPDRLWQNREPVQSQGYITDVITDASINFIESKQDQPFFCYVAYNAPHAPLLVENEVVEPFIKAGVPLEDAQIYGMVQRIDDNIGRLLKVLDDRGLRDNTIVLFMCDNGGLSKSYKGGLRGFKGSVYEGGIRSPLFVSWKGHFPAGAKVASQAHAIDLLPTFCEIAGVPTPADRPIDGQSLLSQFKSGTGGAPDRQLFHTWNRDRPQAEKNWAVSERQFKLVNGQLYDLIADPGETTNLAAGQPDTVKRLRNDYLRWLDDVCKGQNFGRERIEVGRADENPVELQASWADRHGQQLKYTFQAYDWDIIDGWSQPGDNVTWEVDVVNAGTYAVDVSYATDRQSAGGTFRVSSGDSQTPVAIVEPTAAPQAIISRSVGTITLPVGQATLKFEALSLSKNDRLMTLNLLKLRRLDAPADNVVK